MVVIILVGRLALGIAYSVVVPAYEGFDEHHHYEYVRYIATKRHLLRPGEYDSEVLWEKFQAPLYYVLAGPFMSWIDVSDNYEPVSNRYFPSETSGPYYHLPAKWEAFPYRGTVLALHVIRLVSVFIATLGVLFTYLAARVISPKHSELAIGAMLVHALWPQLLCHGSMVTNDVLAATMGSIVTFLLAKVVMDREYRGWQLLALGVSLGLALLTKLNGLALLPVALLVMAGKAALGLGRSRGRGRAIWGLASALSLAPMLVALEGPQSNQ